MDDYLGLALFEAGFRKGKRGRRLSWTGSFMLPYLKVR